MGPVGGGRVRQVGALIRGATGAGGGAEPRAVAGSGSESWNGLMAAVLQAWERLSSSCTGHGVRQSAQTGLGIRRCSALNRGGGTCKIKIV